MTDREGGASEYLVKQVKDAREASPLAGDYNDGDHAEMNCPSCEYSILLTDLIQEAGTKCEGCGRNVRLHITSHDLYAEWRNIAIEEREAYR